MNRFVIALLAFWALAATTWADTPVGPMNYQGRLLDNAGIPLTGSYNFVVRVYDAASGGVLKYQESHSNVAVDDGVYSFLVGTQAKTGGDSTWSVELWNCCSALYLEIAVGAETLSPRHRLAAAPFAFQANLALTTNNALNAQALGGKSAGSVLGDICLSGKGKWLELAQKCLGVGASFPGPSMVNLSTLTASTDLSNLDLTNADVSGINFGAANFTGTIFKGTTLNGAGIGSANMTDTVWDGVIATGTKIFSNNFTGAKVGNIDMTGWSLSGATLTGSSMANLIACPAALPAAPAPYRCRAEVQNNRYAIVGPNMNFSSTSLLANRLGQDPYSSNEMFLNTTSGTYQVPVSLAGASFQHNELEGISIAGVDLSNTDFAGAKLHNVNFEYNNFSGATFNQSEITASRFFGTQAAGGAIFSSAHLNGVVFYPGAEGTVSAFQFGGQFLLDSVVFGGSTADGDISLDFNTGTWKNVSFEGPITYLYAIGVEVFGGLFMGPNVTPSGFENLNVHGGNVGGNFANTDLNNSWFTNVSFNGANFTGTTGMDTNTYTNVNWYGAICPDGHPVTTWGDSCAQHLIP